MPFSHEALLYDGTDGLLAGALPYIRDGLAHDERVRVAAREQTTEPLRAALGADAARVEFMPIDRNPARIIPFWRDFVSAHEGPVRGIGEPIFPGRGEAELVECQLHESLLNVAFEDDFRLLCPYDTSALDEAVIHEARCSHPVVDEEPSASYRRAELPLAPLPPPPPGARLLGFDADSLAEVRRLVEEFAGPDFVLAVDELAVNSIRHGGGRGIVRLWIEEDDVVCEVRDQGRIDDPLAGRARPDTGAFGGRGLWIANAVCDLVQIRPGAVRVRTALALPSR